MWEKPLFGGCNADDERHWRLKHFPRARRKQRNHDALPLEGFDEGCHRCGHARHEPCVEAAYDDALLKEHQMLDFHQHRTWAKRKQQAVEGVLESREVARNAELWCVQGKGCVDNVLIGGCV